MVQEQQLIIFTRFPVPGKTKTRLISHLGADHAAQLQKEMTEHIVRHACRATARVEVRYTGGTLIQMQNWLGADLDYAEQGDGDLGERMERTFVEHFIKGAPKVVIVGSDSPSNAWENMQAAFLALDDHDCVIGPAHDGGYYSIGLKKPAPQLFCDIEWGSERVLDQTLQSAAGLAVETLKPLYDIDQPYDIPPTISVIIPTLNEETHLFKSIGKVREGFSVEVIVADGGSQDRTLEKSIGARVVKCSGGRAAQQNAAAKEASGEILLFLHADTMLPNGWDWIVRETLAEPDIALGAFAFKVKDDFPGREFIEGTANWRSKRAGLPYGDQGLFLRKETFEFAGGLPDMPIMEDYAFVRSLRRLGKIKTVPEVAVTSGRRWKEHGVFKVTVVNILMLIGYHLGISPDRLATFYRQL